MSGTAEDYVRVGRNTVEGWFSETDAWMFLAVDATQRDQPGDLLEVGVFMGRPPSFWAIWPDRMSEC